MFDPADKRINKQLYGIEIEDQTDGNTGQILHLRVLNCSYAGCKGTIDVLKQSRNTGGGVFVCPVCDNKSYMDRSGGLVTDKEYGKIHDAMCET